jgi:DoxX-like protein
VTVGSVYLTITLITVAMNVWAAGADFSRARFVLDNSAELGIPLGWVLPLGLLKAAGALGLLLGLFGVPLIGTAAAGGLVLFFLGALVVHVRARVMHNIAAPLAFFAASVGALVSAVAG